MEGLCTQTLRQALAGEAQEIKLDGDGDGCEGGNANEKERVAAATEKQRRGNGEMRRHSQQNEMEMEMQKSSRNQTLIDTVERPDTQHTWGGKAHVDAREVEYNTKSKRRREDGIEQSG